MLTHWLEQQTRKIQARNIYRGQAESDARWRAWYQRQLDKGFALPPPPPPENPCDGA